MALKVVQKITFHRFPMGAGRVRFFCLWHVPVVIGGGQVGRSDRAGAFS